MILQKIFANVLFAKLWYFYHQSILLNGIFLQVNETNKGSYLRTLKDDECLLQVQRNWVKASEWSFWLIRKEVMDSPTFEFRPTRDKELEIPIDVSYLNREYSVLTIPMSDDSTCTEVIEKVRK